MEIFDDAGADGVSVGADGEAAKQKRNVWGVVAIALCFVVCCVVLDVLTFAFRGEAFPKYYMTSVFLILAVGALVSCIRIRWVQISIFGFLLFVQLILSIANVIATKNINEIISFETFYALEEIFAQAHVQKYNVAWAAVSLSSIVLVFFAAAVLIAVLFRKQRAGYALKNLFAALCVAAVSVTSVFVNIAVINRNDYKDYLQMLVDPNFSVRTFSNRTMIMNSFGSPMFYTGNFFRLFDFMSLDNADEIDAIDLGWDDVRYYDEYPTLDADTNMIFLMMETVEFDGIHPLVTPNLSRVQNMSTWVDGYYSTERTCFPEHTALTGGHVLGVEMWREYRDTARPQALPNIFRRAFEDKKEADGKEFQIGAFHGYDTTFYSRDDLFGRFGFEFIKNQTDYPDAKMNFDITKNSDYEFFKLITEDVAPVGKRFFSYVLNATTHAPHFSSTAVYMNDDGIAAVTDNENAAGDKYKTYLRPDAPDNSLQYVMDNYDRLGAVYPNLYSESTAKRAAAVAYLVALHEYDMGVGVLLEHLESNNMMGNTAIVLASDHYDYMAYAHYLNKNGGGVLEQEPTHKEYPVGEKVAFMVYNPKDAAAVAFDTANAIPEFDDAEALGMYLPQGRKITTFMTSTDIYKTICHLYNIQTNKNFTMGNSVLARAAEFQNEYTPDDVSVGIKFYTGEFYGMKNGSIDAGDGFSTANLKSYSGAQPDGETLAAFRKTLTQYAGTLFKLRSLYDGNDLKDNADCFYTIGGERK